MSIWTHIAGLVVLDNIGNILIRSAPGYDLEDIAKKALEKAFGKTCDFNSPEGDWDSCTVPCGSEGSLQYAVKPYGKDAVQWGQVAIWGDLRDFGEEEYEGLQKWFGESLAKLQPEERKQMRKDASPEEQVHGLMSCFSTRNAVLLVNIEGKEPVALYWNDKELVELRGGNSYD